MAEVRWESRDGILTPVWDFPAPPFDRQFYEKLRKAHPTFRKVEESVISVGLAGKGYLVKKGQSLRITCIEGPQMADVGIWNAHTSKEHFWNDMTLGREGANLTTFTRLWGTPPKFRPMMTIIDDTVQESTKPLGAAHHSCLTAFCDPHYWYWALKDKTHPYVTTYNCYYNLIRAIAPFGLNRDDIHDNINLFTKMYLAEGGRHVMDVSDVKKGDYVEFYAEMDVLVGISVCPGGSGSLHYSCGEQDIKPLGVEIFDTGIAPLEFEDVLGI